MLRLEPRQTAPVWLHLLVPLLATGLTLLLAAALFAAMGFDPAETLRVYFVYPLADLYGLGELLVKASPLLLCALGLMFCFRAGVWNIGAEGQLTVGALTGSAVALNYPDLPGFLLLPLVLLSGALGGMAWASIPAFLRNRWHVNEILTSLLLVYVAQLLLSAMVHGPMRNPEGFNFPESAPFSDAATIPLILEGTRLHAGFLLALVALGVAMLLRGSHVAGFAVSVMGQAQRAATYAGFSAQRIVWCVLLASGALAGLAGILEVSGPIGHLNANVSPGYGFTAIIVAFLGRLHPVGIVFASLLLSLVFLGGELAQIMLKIPNAANGVFQGMLLFILLGCDLLVTHRIRWHPSPAASAA